MCVTQSTVSSCRIVTALRAAEMLAHSWRRWRRFSCQPQGRRIFHRMRSAMPGGRTEGFGPILCNRLRYPVCSATFCGHSAE